jgi:predicted MPP superfamily phosphohydrolase
MVLAFFNILFWNVVSSVMSHLKFPWKREQGQKKFSIVLISLIVSLLMCVSGWYTAVGKWNMVEISIPIDKLPFSLNGTRIVQLSDIHLGPTVGKSMLEDIVARVMVQKPDVIVITGDLIDSSEKSLVEAAAPLGKLKARYGSFFVTGKKMLTVGLSLQGKF